MLIYIQIKFVRSKIFHNCISHELIHKILIQYFHVCTVSKSIPSYSNVEISEDMPVGHFYFYADIFLQHLLCDALSTITDIFHELVPNNLQM